MGEAKFTKGEWHVNDGKVIMCQGSKIAYAYSGESIPYIGKIKANANLIAAAPDMYEENESRSKLLGKIYVALQQGDASGAFNLLHDAEIIDFSSGEPIAVSPALAKARGEHE